MTTSRTHSMSWTLRRLSLAGCLVLSLWAAACSSGGQAPIETPPCTKAADCGTGQGCQAGKCVDLPCAGKCNDDQVCLNNACRSALNLDCSLDADRCPRAFSCVQGRCKRSCNIDNDCPPPGTCNIAGEVFFCAECTLNSDCTDASRPFCDQSAGSCVGCLGSSDCRPNGLPVGKYCEQMTQTCETGCHSVLDCPTGTKTCLNGSDTVAGICADCTANIDCSGGNAKYCDPSQNKCVECLDNSQCASNACDTQKHVCVQCVDDLSCGRGNVCNPQTFKCVPGCTNGSGSAECPPDAPACDPNLGPFGGCVRCVSNTDCPRAQVCDRSGRTPACVAGCDNDARCAPTQEEPNATNTICDPTKSAKGTCVQCRSDANCSNGLVCDTGSGVCRCKKTGETCSDSSQCGYQEIMGPGGTTTFNCQALNSFCMVSVKCSATGEKNVMSVCSGPVKGSGLPDRNPPDSNGCPPGFVVERAKDANASGYTVVCVPNMSPYTCP